MGPWLEIYDCEEVLWQLRSRASAYASAISAALALVVLCGSLVGLSAVPLELAFLTLAVAALCLAVFWTGRLFGLQARVWCVKLSPHMIMAYNYSRRPTAFAWSQVRYVEADDECITIVAGVDTVIEIPSSFSDFAHVSHRVLDLAELHRRPVRLRGREMDDVDVFELLPGLNGALSAALPARSRAA